MTRPVDIVVKETRRRPVHCLAACHACSVLADDCNWLCLSVCAHYSVKNVITGESAWITEHLEQYKYIVCSSDCAEAVAQQCFMLAQEKYKAWAPWSPLKY